MSDAEALHLRPLQEGEATRDIAAGDSGIVAPGESGKSGDVTVGELREVVAGESGDVTTRDSGRRRQEIQPAPAYYDVPMLKPPVWTWEITAYFFLGGMSGGAYALARMANRFGGGRYPEITRAGTIVAVSAFLPCTPLLIADLGDPKRFHMMMRVFRPKSPMSLGAWTLAAFGGVLTLSALNEWRKARQRSEPSASLKAVGSAVDLIADVAGVPLGLLLAGYTGVLLSTTSTPLWARNSWLGPLFSASAVSSGASAIRLVLESQKPAFRDRRVREPLEQVGTVAKVAEAVSLGGFLVVAGELAKPVTQGKYAPHLWGGAVGAGLVLSTVLDSIPVQSEKTRRRLRIAGAVAGLVGGLALRWAISQGGHASGLDPDAARKASQSKS
jgi:formate-dependent nitrite reductase membrane component NrfD